MRIAIATMSRDISFGGNLQAYAVQKTICENSHSSSLHKKYKRMDSGKLPIDVVVADPAFILRSLWMRTYLLKERHIMVNNK